jgi:phosphinothricin acetyltransferase
VTEVRPGRLDDLPALTAIYNHYVVETAVTFDLKPFAVDERRGWFDQYAATGPHRLLVAERDGVAVGYATSSRFRPKAAYQPSVEVTVYLDPARVGGGTGTLLYQRLFEELANEPVHRAYAGIALPNPASVALHRKFGFHDVGTLHEVGHKHGQWWDVLWMERTLPT